MLKITPISAFNDNYIWAISSTNSSQVAVVDPGDPIAVIDFLTANNLQLNAILLTHHHQDHIGGVQDLLDYAKVPVYGPRSTFIRTVTNPVTEGSIVNLTTQDLQLKVMEIPAHTLDHVAYYNDQILFCGDTIFTGGCGRVFEGTPEQMLHALQRLAALNPQTKVYCGHEYTVHNLRFASLVEPSNQAIIARLQQAEQLQENDMPTVPALLAEELATNPFLRTQQPSVIAAVEKYYKHRINSEVEIFAALRAWKNNF